MASNILIVWLEFFLCLALIGYAGNALPTWRSSESFFHLYSEVP